MDFSTQRCVLLLLAVLVGGCGGGGSNGDDSPVSEEGTGDAGDIAVWNDFAWNEAEWAE